MRESYAGRVWSSFAGTLGIVSPWSAAGNLSGVTFSDMYPDVDPDELAEIVPIDRSSALAVPALAKCRHTLVTACSGLPLVPTSSRATMPALARQLDPGRANVVTLAGVFDALFFYGRAWLYVLDRESGPAGRPAALRWIPESAIEVDGDGDPIKVNGRDLQRRDDLLRVDGITEGILAPHAGLTIRRATRAESAAARAMDNPVPSVELHQTGGEPLNKAERRLLLDGWAAARRGANGGVAFTSSSIEAKTHGQAAEQLLINGRNASAIDCARVAGMPAWVVDGTVQGSSLTYSNVPSRSREFLDYTARGYLDAVEGRLSMDDVTPRGQALRFDLLRLLRGDFLDRMTAGKTAIEAGIYTAAEIRALDSDTPNDPTGESA